VEVIEGFEKAKSRLSRQSPVVVGQVSSSLQEKVEAVFGEGATPELAVMTIINDVSVKGDRAVRHYTSKIDKVKLETLEVDVETVSAAVNDVDSELLDALKLAAERIEAFHVDQRDRVCCGVSGDECSQMVRPLERVGLYAPGGTASYPSTVLMTAIPARVAGVKEIILATPPGKDGKIPVATLAAAHIAGVDRVFSIGGAQAIAAMAFGTESVPRVDKICGPGNIFVVMAKKAVYGVVDIDGLQGPSEVVIIADETANPEYCATDLLAQAEHDAQSEAILVTTSKDMADKVKAEVEKQLAELPRKDIAAESLENKGVIAVVGNLEEAIELANLYAPEHLELMIKDTPKYLDKVQNAGCVFVGENSTVALGDYVAGPSHVLPTGGTARFSSPLSVTDFIKIIDVVNISEDNLEKTGKAAMTIAQAEGLDAHMRAMERRVG